MRYVVVGGRGYLGAKAVRALREAGVEVAVAGRSGPVAVDLHDPSTFRALREFDVVINVSSSHAAAPYDLAAYCLREGKLHLEASSERTVVERLSAPHGTDAECAGAVVLGAGIFTGLSNLLAASVAAPGCERLELGVASSPFSGAGGATVDLMSDALKVGAAIVKDGVLGEGPPVASGPTLPFPGADRRTIEVAFPEPGMLAKSTHAREIRMYMAPKPSPLRAAFLLTPAFVLRSWLFGAYLRLVFGFLRRVLLRKASTGVELVARGTSNGTARTRTIGTDDGMEAGGVAIAAIALEVGAAKPRGTRMVDEVTTLDAVVGRMKSLAPSLRVELR
jgi:short subunit dehydrogenase-like uncharacterized protein